MTVCALAKTDQIRILIVEDDEDDAFLVEEMLSDGITMNAQKIERAYTFAQALEKLVEREYDVCIFDYNLGKNTGVDLLINIRSRGIDVPVIFLTGNSNPNIEEDIRNSGADDMFLKMNISSMELSHSVLKTLQMV